MEQGPTDTARVFAAIAPPEAMCEALARELANTPDVNWMPASNMHVTLVFDPACADVPALLARLRAAVTGQTPFRLRIGGAGSFQTRRNSTLWLAARGTTDADEARLHALKASIGGRADGVEHLTLTRTKEPEAALDAITALPARDWLVEGIGLYQSLLGQGPDGRSRYELLATLPFSPL